ncbi:MAG: SH3 domain-containing protein [Cocleimonas sp.]|nr:SH3 domain-containing protein [Cocleimonas sp.]
MKKKGCHCAARICGFFVCVLLLLSACSSDESNLDNAPSQITPADTQQKNQPPLKKQPFNQLILNKISIDYPYTPDNSFTAFIRKLRARIDNKNMRGMLGELSSRFICQSAICKKGLPIDQQFENIVNSFGATSWDSLLKMADTKHYQQINGHICGPASAQFTGEGRKQAVGVGWGYINAADVRLRKKPTTKSSVITHLTQDAVRLISTNKIEKQGLQWIEIETLKGQKGFIAEKFFLMLTPPQLCYQQVMGEWKISGFRSP